MLQLDLLIVDSRSSRRSSVRLAGRAHAERCPGGSRWRRWSSQAALLAALVPVGAAVGRADRRRHLGGLASMWSTVARRAVDAARRCSRSSSGSLAVLASWDVDERPGAFFALLLALQAALSRRLPRRQPHAVLRGVGVGAHPDVLPHRRVGLVEPPARRRRSSSSTRSPAARSCSSASSSRSPRAAAREHLARSSAGSAGMSTPDARLLAASPSRFLVKIPAVPVPHLAARRAHRGADRRLDRARRRAAQDGRLRADAHRACRSRPTAFAQARVAARGARARRHRLRRGDGARADRPEAARRVLVGLAHGLRDARDRGRDTAMRWARRSWRW